MNVAHAEFVLSNTKVELCPKSKIPEYAFIGRSNVGKSSLINMLCNRKKLAKTNYYDYWDENYLQEVLEEDYNRLFNKKRQ